MNETVDHVYRFVTDQSSSAYHKMNSFVASLRRRFDKVLTVPGNYESRASSITDDGENSQLDEMITQAHLLLAMTDNAELNAALHAAETRRQQPHSPTSTRRLVGELRALLSLSRSDAYYLASCKSDQSAKPEKNANVYDTLNKRRPIALSNPTVNQIGINEAGKPVHMQRHSLRSSMRHFMKRRSIKNPSKKILGLADDPSAPHIYESLDSPSSDAPSFPVNPMMMSPNPLPAPPAAPTVLKSSYILPSSTVVFDHFTTNLYLVVNTTLNQLLVVFGSTKIHTIKFYDNNGRKVHANDLTLQYQFEDLHGYKVLCSAMHNSGQNRLIVNEIRVYVSQPSDELHNPSVLSTN